MKTRKMKNVRPVDSDQALPANHPTVTMTDVVTGVSGWALSNLG
jgi:hypothetical protein